MNIKVLCGNGEAEFEAWTFPGGEEHARLITFRKEDRFVVNAKIKSSSDLMQMLMVSDAIKGNGVEDIHLEIPYFPYARQDRRCESGDCFGLNVAAKIINQFGYKTVTVVDPHSDVLPALVDRCKVVSQVEVLHRSGLAHKFIKHKIVSPDSGSVKKAFRMAQYLSIGVIRADKIRDVATGEIVETKVFEDSIDVPCVVFDDICDGGRTFIELAKKLKEKGCPRVELFVTHGIFSKGYEPLLESGIDHIYTTDSLNPETSESVTIIKL